MKNSRVARTIRRIHDRRGVHFQLIIRGHQAHMIRTISGIVKGIELDEQKIQITNETGWQFTFYLPL